MYSKSKVGPKPFESYRVYAPSVNSEGRAIIALIPKPGVAHKRTSMSYARYLMSIALGRKLAADEHVDHIDGDKTNDVIENLQILTPQANHAKQMKELGITRRMVELKCPGCGGRFIKRRIHSHLSKGYTFTSCSRKCRAITSKKIQDGHDLSQELADNVVRKYEEKVT